MGGTLSGGQQRLLSLAKVLVVPSKVLVADELSLGLAPVVVDQVYEGLREINRNGTALVVVEQQVHRVLELATWAVVLNHGSVAYEGEPAGAGKAVESLMARREEAAAIGRRPRRRKSPRRMAEAAANEYRQHHRGQRRSGRPRNLGHVSLRIQQPRRQQMREPSSSTSCARRSARAAGHWPTGTRRTCWASP